MSGNLDLRPLTIEDRCSEDACLRRVAMTGERELKRRSGIEVPNLGRIDAMPSVDHIAGKEKVNRSSTPSRAVWSRLTPSLAKEATLRVRREVENSDDVISCSRTVGKRDRA